MAPFFVDHFSLTRTLRFLSTRSRNIIVRHSVIRLFEAVSTKGIVIGRSKNCKCTRASFFSAAAKYQGLDSEPSKPITVPAYLGYSS